MSRRRAVTEYQVASNVQDLEGITAGPDGAMWFVNESQETIDRITTGGALTEFQMPSNSALERHHDRSGPPAVVR